MAVAKSIREGLNALNDTVFEVQTLAKVMLDLAHGGEDEPQWPWLFSVQLERVQQAAEALEIVLRQKAIPLLEDFDSVKG